MTRYNEVPRYVYILRPVGQAGPVKIGCSDMPTKRLKEIATWSPIPLELVVTVPGNMVLEHNLHDCFADLYSHREWFRVDDRLQAFIDKLVAGVAVADAIDLTDKRGNIRSERVSALTGQWLTTDGGKLYMSFRQRLRWALQRAGLEWRHAPEVVRHAIFRIREEGLTEAQRAEIEAYLAAPFDDTRKAAA